MVYLPSPGFLGLPRPTPDFLLKNHPVVCINYRWSNALGAVSGRSSSLPGSSGRSDADSQYFPTPLHDVLQAFTWLTSELLPLLSLELKKMARQTETESQPRPLVLYGDELGGTLATSLALTETRRVSTSARERQPSYHISALITKDATFDFSSILASSFPGSVTDRRKGLQTSTTAIDSGSSSYDLQQLFSDPSQAHDPFISPLLFFRTASWEVPPCFPSQLQNSRATGDSSTARADRDDEDHFTDLEYEYAISSATTLPKGPVAITNYTPQKARSAYLKFPPRDSNIRIPPTLFLVSGKAAVKEDEQILVKPKTRRRAPKIATTGSETSQIGDALLAPTKRKTRRKVKDESEGEKQTKDMIKAMRRSINLEAGSDTSDMPKRLPDQVANQCHDDTDIHTMEGGQDTDNSDSNRVYMAILEAGLDQESSIAQAWLRERGL